MDAKEVNQSMVKMIRRAVRWFEKEYPNAIKHDYSISYEFIGKSMATITINVNKFLSDNPSDRREFELLEEDMKIMADKCEATSHEVIEASYGGDVARAVIRKNGPMIDPNILMSHLTCRYSFPVNFKR
jgi:NACalpha-BTF3-like transcription factor